MAPSGPPCSQQHSAQTKVNSEADLIKKMIRAARLALSSNGKRLRLATRITLGSNHTSKILPSNTPDFSVMFSAGRASTEMDPFAKRKLRGSIAARASVVSSRERSAAKRRTTTLCFVKRVRIVIFETLEFLHLLIVS